MCGALLLHNINTTIQSVYLNATATRKVTFANGLHFVCHKHRTQLNELINDYRSRYTAAASRLMLTNKTNRKVSYKKRHPIGIIVCASLSEASPKLLASIRFEVSKLVHLFCSETSPIFMLWWYLSKASNCCTYVTFLKSHLNQSNLYSNWI